MRYGYTLTMEFIAYVEHVARTSSRQDADDRLIQYTAPKWSVATEWGVACMLTGEDLQHIRGHLALQERVLGTETPAVYFHIHIFAQRAASWRALGSLLGTRTMDRMQAAQSPLHKVSTI